MTEGLRDFYDVFSQIQNKDDDDPYNNFTPQMMTTLLNMCTQRHDNVRSYWLISTILLAPIQTVVNLLQLSVEPHRNIYKTESMRKQELALLNTQLTVAQKRQMQLQLQVGSAQQPYRAPIYPGYLSILKDLKEQGVFSFFKGTLFRIFINLRIFSYTLGVNLSTVSIYQFKQFDQQLFQSYRNKGTMLSYLLLCTTDFLLAPFYGSQVRYTLQNNRPNFKVFDNLLANLKKYMTRQKIPICFKYHLTNNILQVWLKFPLIWKMCFEEDFNGWVLYNVIEFVTYPFTTAFRRVMAQSKIIPGMLPHRYTGVAHCLKLMYSEEKKALWKGYCAYLFLVNLRLKIVSASCLLAHRNQLGKLVENNQMPL